MRSGGRVLVAAGAVLLAGAASAVACSDGAQAVATDDAGGNLDASVDATIVEADSALSAPPDVADVAPIPPPPDSAPPLVGKCEPVQGPACDLVLQQCPPGDGGVAQQCIAQRLADGGYTTECIPVTASQHLQKGHGCCPSGGNSCDSPLECIGDPNAPCDGGVLPGRCTPHCCGGDAGDDYLCGTSVPEGYPGHCNTLVVDNNGVPLYNACTYELACKPFKLQPCPAGLACEIQDPTGTAGCTTIYLPNGGAPPSEGQTCVALNNCADGLVCLNTGATGNCYMMCLTPGTTPPFNPALLDGGPGQGGCPVGEACNIVVGGFPAWISFCGP